jgi:nitroreductase
MSKSAPPSYETQSLRDLEEVIRGRRTINLYLQTPVPVELVREAIEAATWAPNHHVTEPWHFYLLGARAIEQCLDLCRDLVTAAKGPDAAEFKRESWSEKPGWLVVTCRRSDDELLQREDYAACAAAVQNFMLYLWKAGVGSKWTTGDITRDARFFDIIGSNADEEFVVGLLWFGYPKVTPAQRRKGLDEVLSELP